MKQYCRYPLLLLLFFPLLLSSANMPPDLLEKMRDKYPGENMIALKREVKYVIENKKGELQISLSENEQNLYLQNAATIYSSLKAYGNDFIKLKDYKANSYVMQKDKYKRIPVKKYKITDDRSASVFYDDVKEYDFEFPGVTEGTVTELQTEYTVEDPKFLRSLYLQYSYPIDVLSVEIECDASVELDFIFKNFTDTIAVRQEKGKRIYTWSASAIQGYKSEEYRPNFLYFVPHIIPVIRSYEKEEAKEILFQDVSSLYKWYYDFVSEVNKEVDAKEMELIVKDLVKDCKTNKEKVQAVYRWVQDHIKYIAFEDGMGGFVPREADEICKKRYGDCKDNSSIMKEMLSIAGVPVYFTWVGTRDLPYRYSEVPTLGVSNHMIITYKEDSAYYFLDATGRFLDMHYPSSFIQQKEVLIALSDVDYEVVEIAKVESERNLIRDSVSLVIDQKNLKGQGCKLLRGYSKLNFQNFVQRIEEQDYKEDMEAYLELGSNKFVLDSVSEVDKDSYENTMRMSYFFTLPAYVRSHGDELYVNLNLERYFTTLKLKKDRTVPVLFTNTKKIHQIFVLEVPDGYSVDFLPENAARRFDGFGYSIAYALKGNKIVYEATVDLNTLMLNKEQFGSWNLFLKDLEKAYNNSIVLKKS